MIKTTTQKLANKLENDWYDYDGDGSESEIFYWFAKRLIRAKKQKL